MHQKHGFSINLGFWIWSDSFWKMFPTLKFEKIPCFENNHERWSTCSPICRAGRSFQRNTFRFGPQSLLKRNSIVIDMVQIKHIVRVSSNCGCVEDEKTHILLDGPGSFARAHSLGNPNLVALEKLPFSDATFLVAAQPEFLGQVMMREWNQISWSGKSSEHWKQKLLSILSGMKLWWNESQRFHREAPSTKQSPKGANLPLIKQSQVVYKSIDGSGSESQQLRARK